VSQSETAESPRDLGLPFSRDLARLRAFGPATLIETRRGPVPAIEVRAGDRLFALDGTYAEVIWTDRLRLDADFLRRTPQLKPVLFCEGDLGLAPTRNVVLSPEQFVWDETASNGGAFRRAADVTRHPSLFALRDVEVTYVSLLCAEPVVIEVEGLWISLIP
jgi:hypothetical protein